MIVAVDGPSGAGKSTVCRAVAGRIGMTLLDTGALYRAVAWRADARGVALDDGPAVGALAVQMNVRFAPGDGEQRVLVDDEDVTSQIRTAMAGLGASVVSAQPEVRAALLELQRTLGRAGDTLVEGRDIGTVVFPDAALKVYFTASVEARAQRRFDELVRRGEDPVLIDVRKAIEERDERDSTRDVAPLRRADDAVLLDTSDVDFEGACAALERLVREALEAHR